MTEGPVRELSDCYPATATAVAQARRDLGTFAAQAGFDVTQADCVRLAVSEAVTNAVRHAYPRGDGHVWVDASLCDGRLVVAVADTGHGMAVPSGSPGLGVGLSLIAAVTESVTISAREGGGTELRMSFRRASPA